MPPSLEHHMQAGNRCATGLSRGAGEAGGQRFPATTAGVSAGGSSTPSLPVNLRVTCRSRPAPVRAIRIWEDRSNSAFDNFRSLPGDAHDRPLPVGDIPATGRPHCIVHRYAWQAAAMSMGTLVLLRHGESEWNAKNLFTGWVDVPLSVRGEREAARCGELMSEAGLEPDVVHTSLLRRAISTAHLALDAADRHWIPVRRDWRLNERHYGALQGMNKAQIRAEYGDQQFALWRRSYGTRPPPIERGSAFSQDKDPRYAGVDVPTTECLADVVARMMPYWESFIVPELRAGCTVLVSAHGNSLRALVKHLDGIDDQTIAGVNIPTGIPLRYDFDDQLRPVTAGGAYLDPDAAADAIAVVAQQGR
jgi:2,3-bisphosphoglycerate-dependent phosphoglycerate mutase